jgi:hypothetical protein
MRLRPLGEESCLRYAWVSRSKARRTGLDVFQGRGAKGNVLVSVYERKRRCVVTALEIERLVVGGVDVSHLTGVQGNSNAYG